jgi:TonB family protein
LGHLSRACLAAAFLSCSTVVAAAGDSPDGGVGPQILEEANLGTKCGIVELVDYADRGGGGSWWVTLQLRNRCPTEQYVMVESLYYGSPDFFFNGGGMAGWPQWSEPALPQLPFVPWSSIGSPPAHLLTPGQTYTVQANMMTQRDITVHVWLASCSTHDRRGAGIVMFRPGEYLRDDPQVACVSRAEPAVDALTRPNSAISANGPLPAQQIDAEDYGPIPVKPVSLLNYLVTSADYPVDAIRAEASGRVEIEVRVAANGTIADCLILSSSGNASLDQRTCDIARERLQFSPAGREGFYRARILWSLGY